MRNIEGQTKPLHQMSKIQKTHHTQINRLIGNLEEFHNANILREQEQAFTNEKNEVRFAELQETLKTKSAELANVDTRVYECE